MKKFVLFMFLTVFTCSVLFSQESTRKVLLLPFQAENTGDEYRAAKDNVEALLFESFYSYLSIFPWLELPEKDVLQVLEPGSMAIEKLTAKEKADFLVQGSYTLSGDTLEPDIRITIHVWSRQDRKFIHERTVESVLDLDIFDSIDQITSESLISAFNIKSGFATLEFSGFQIGNGQYTLLVNRKKRMEITNENFFYSMKILGDTRYLVEIRHKESGTVYKERLVVPAGTVTNISHKAEATLRLKKMVDFDRRKEYFLYLNDVLVEPKNSYPGMGAGIPHTLTTYDSLSNQLLSTNFFLQDRKTLIFKPSAGHFIRNYASVHISLQGWGIQLQHGQSQYPFYDEPVLPLVGLGYRWAISRSLGVDTGIKWMQLSTAEGSSNPTNYWVNYFIIPAFLTVTFPPNWIRNTRISLGAGGDILLYKPGIAYGDYRYLFAKLTFHPGIFVEWWNFVDLFFRLGVYYPLEYVLADPNSNFAIEKNNWAGNFPNVRYEMGYRLSLW